MKKKLPSFTIAEMLVVLVISAIIVTLSFTILNLVQKRFYNFQFNLEQQSEDKIITGRLLRDLNYYNHVKLGTDNVIRFTNPLDSLEYRFEKPYVLMGADTVANNIQQVWFYYKGEQINKGAVDALKINTGTHEDFYFMSRRNSVEEKFRFYED